MRFTVLSLLALLTITGCQPEKKQLPVAMSVDPHSYAKPEEARVTHLYWKASVNPDTKIIQATASWTIEASADADSIRLDTKGLNIEKVTLDDNQPAAFVLAAQDPLLGQALVIPLKPGTK